MKNAFLEDINKDILQYAVGALLYIPAINKDISKIICTRKYNYLTSVSLCLEDSIADNMLEQAETQIISELRKISDCILKNEVSVNDIPLIFIRIRNPEQMEKLFYEIKDFNTALTGFVLPKFDLSNADKYKQAILKINKNSEKVYYIMPILESGSIINTGSRIKVLTELKDIIDGISEYTLNIRVGANDLCNEFGLRRSCKETIYDIEVVKAAIVDIFNVFGRDYVISGTVWEYFDNPKDDNWKIGLQKELYLDRVNGLIGKTAIHPSQVPVILDSMRVSPESYEDAKNILNWNDESLGVAKSANGNRMNEPKVHKNWAKKIMCLANIYGVAE